MKYIKNCLLLMAILIMPLNNLKAEILDDDYTKIKSRISTEEVQKNLKSSLIIERITKFIENNRSYYSTYPDFIGGIYINNDNNVIIQIVDKLIPDKNSKYKKLYDKIINFDEKIMIEYVDNPYYELEYIIDSLNEKFTNGELDGIVNNYYLDTINNKIVIGLTSLDENTIQKFKEKQYLTKGIVFTIGEKYISTIDLDAGASLNFGCSVGYRARKNNFYNGFVTAGHCVTLGSETSYGKVEFRQFSGDIDAAWINTTTTNYVPTNSFYNYSNLPASPTYSLNTMVSTSYAVGKYVGKVGRTSGYREGKITSASLAFTYEDTKFTNQIGTNVYQVEGDSGNVVFETNNYHMTMGIGTFRDGNYNMIFSRADKINDKFGLKRY